MKSDDGLVRIGDSVFPSKEAAEDVGYAVSNLGDLAHNDSNFTYKNGLEKELQGEVSLFEGIPDDVIDEAYELIHNPNILKWDRPNDRGRKKILRRLRELGVPIQPYSKLNSEGSEEYFCEVQKGICKEYKTRTSPAPLSR